MIFLSYGIKSRKFSTQQHGVELKSAEKKHRKQILCPLMLVPKTHFKHHCTIQTRWADNDVYGHVNNVVYYSYFDTMYGF